MRSISSSNNIRKYEENFRLSHVGEELLLASFGIYLLTIWGSVSNQARRLLIPRCNGYGFRQGSVGLGATGCIGHALFVDRRLCRRTA